MKILFVGDSWADGQVVGDNNSHGFLDILEIPEELRHGVRGSTAAQWASDFDGRLTKAVTFSCDPVVIIVGGNDFRGVVGDGNVTGAEITKLYADVNSVCKAFDSQDRVYIGLYACPFTDVISRAATVLMNHVIKLAADGYATVLDFSQTLGDDDFDGQDIHPLMSGHEKMAALISEVVK